MEVYVHIGIHKTGSTLFQKRIFNKLEGIYYVPRDESLAFKKYILYTDDFEFDVEKAREIFNEIPKVDKQKKVLISDEELYGNPYWATIDRKRNIDRLINIFAPNIKIIVFIRNQNTLLNSLYNQYIKTGGTANLNSFLSYKKYPHCVNIEYFCFDKYLTYIITSIERQNIKIILFEEFKKNSRKTILDIIDFLKIPEPTITENDLLTTNESINNTLLPFLRFTNKFTKSVKNPFSFLNLKVHLSLRALTYKLSKIFPKDKKKPIFSMDDINHIKQSNKNLSEILNTDLSKYNYPLN
ncbi:hypothetical protein ADIS_3638 [Lunatimonas lonarensis]|uniref:Sulfotransferase domain-containing protein n=1 Tax=Lunatimonas lonarensis TaxID=1232681 RepID=R7ZP38_9BACT|nr:sulfotransferase domain-containing protein [Lunatimonas lonarensis]EON75881.1 hypothetical protein ADIS_3638 [Lunatimonas lonarensis]